MGSNKKLLTPKIHKLIVTGVTYGELLQAHPFKWNHAKDQPEKVTSNWRLLLWKVNVVISSLYYVFLIGRFFQAFFYADTAGMSQKIYMFFVLVFYSFVPMVNVNIILKRNEFSSYVRNSMTFIRKCEESFIKDKARTPKFIKYCEWATRFTYINFNLNIVVIVAVSIFQPRSPEFLSSLMFNYFDANDRYGDETDPLTLKLIKTSIIIISSTFQLYIMYMFIAKTFVLIFTFFCITCLHLVLLDELRLTTGTGNQELRDPFVKIRLWKALQVNVHNTDQMYMVGIAGAKILLILFAVFCAYGAIKFEGVLAIGLGILGSNCTIFLGLMYSLLCQVYEKSHGALDEWKRAGETTSTTLVMMTSQMGMNRRQCQFQEGQSLSNGNGELLKKYMKSLRSFSGTIGGMYNVDKVMVLTMFKFILESTVNFILMYG